MKELKLSDLCLPIEAVTQTFAFLGKRGGGKSYAAMKLAELMLQAKAQIVALDPIGIWWSLRMSADGKNKGFSIPVFGGEHGDVPLEPHAGALIAKLIVEGHFSAILDVSTFRKNERKQFVTDFAEELLHRKKSNRSAVHVFFEESQVFVPQKIFKGEERMLGAFEDLIKLGRNYGIGASLISQRPQSVNKDVLNQTEVLLAFQMTGPQERKTIEGWISEKVGNEKRENLAEILPSLKIGEAHLWSPQWLQVSMKIKIAKRVTYDSSSTPSVGSKIIKTKDLSPVDVAKIRESMSDIVKRADERDPKKLQQRIRQLEAEAAKRIPATKEVTKEITVEVPVLPEIIKDFAVDLRRQAGALSREADALSQKADAFEDALNNLSNVVRPTAIPIPKPKPQPQKLTGLSRGTGKTYSAGDRSLPDGERKCLTVAAQFTPTGGATREQITILADYKRSTRDAYIQRLSAKGLVTTVGKLVKATDQGFAALGSDFEPLPTGAELREYWIHRLPEGERKVLEVCIGRYPNHVDRETISDETAYKRSTRDAYIQRLAVRKLVQASKEGVKASDDLY